MEDGVFCGTISLMSWASRRRTTYVVGVLAFFALVIGVPVAIWLYEPPACFDRKQNQGETAVDKGGPCALLDERTLSPSTILWSRAFSARTGSYNAVAYIENPNRDAGVPLVYYRFGLYDERNVLVAERQGRTFIMPGGITPVFQGAIDTGSRTVARTYFEFTSAPQWIRAADSAEALTVSNKSILPSESTPRLTARAKNTSVAVILDPSFVAVIFDTAGNAIAASATTLSRLAGGEEGELVFTWSVPFERAVGRIDILPLLAPDFEK